MTAYLTIVRYKPFTGFLGVISMALFRPFLKSNRNISFFKLLGCGKNGSFDKSPDWNQWGLITVHNEAPSPNKNLLSIYGKFIPLWWMIFKCELWTVALQPIEGHGTWNNKQCFGILPKNTEYDKMICVLTRASIKLNRLNEFWSHVSHVSKAMAITKGYIYSIGVGEIPFVKQATFSIWESKKDMKSFAYGTEQHKDVIKKTIQRNWYSEEMFVRFIPIYSFGSIKGINPLNGKLAS